MMKECSVTGKRPWNGRLDLQRFAQDKTEAPTPKRRRDARKKGQVPRSADIVTAIMVLVTFVGVHALLGWMGEQMVAFTRFAFLQGGIRAEWSASDVHRILTGMLMQGATVAMPVMAMGFLVAFLGQLAQVGFLVTGEVMKPKLQRLNPVFGLKRMFSKRAAFEFLKALLKSAVIAWICYNIIRSSLPLFPQLALLAPDAALLLVAELARKIGLYAGGLLLVLGLGDYAFQRFEHLRSIRMSKQELKEEQKQSEGDPLIRGRLRQRQREIAMRRMIHEVPKADVVITNPTHIAVAIRYDIATMDAPVVVAKGAGPIAERIRKVASEHRVTIVENRPLARALFDAVPVGGQIPPQLYRAVAEVLAFVYRMKRRVP